MEKPGKTRYGPRKDSSRNCDAYLDFQADIQIGHTVIGGDDTMQRRLKKNPSIATSIQPLFVQSVFSFGFKQ
jgi:hypothetical protein